MGHYPHRDIVKHTPQHQPDNTRHRGATVPSPWESAHSAVGQAGSPKLCVQGSHGFHSTAGLGAGRMTELGAQSPALPGGQAAQRPRLAFPVSSVGLSPLISMSSGSGRTPLFLGKLQGYSLSSRNQGQRPVQFRMTQQHQTQRPWGCPCPLEVWLSLTPHALPSSLSGSADTTGFPGPTGPQHPLWLQSVPACLPLSKPEGEGDYVTSLPHPAAGTGPVPPAEDPVRRVALSLPLHSSPHRWLCPHFPSTLRDSSVPRQAPGGLPSGQGQSVFSF